MLQAGRGGSQPLAALGHTAYTTACLAARDQSIVGERNGEEGTGTGCREVRDLSGGPPGTGKGPGPSLGSLAEQALAHTNYYSAIFLQLSKLVLLPTCLGEWAPGALPKCRLWNQRLKEK